MDEVGVRRKPEELRYNAPSVIASVDRKAINVITAKALHIASMSSYAENQASDRKVSAKEIIDSLKNPMYIKPIKKDALDSESQQFVGAYATAAVNPNNGIVTSVWKTSKSKRDKYIRKE